MVMNKKMQNTEHWYYVRYSSVDSIIESIFNFFVHEYSQRNNETWPLGAFALNISVSFPLNLYVEI